MADVQYPIGKFEEDPDATDAKRAGWIQVVTDTPGLFRRAVAGLRDPQLETTYRPGGWTVRQVVHHMPDAHLHTMVRFRLALTEDNPLVPGYAPPKWAELPDAKTGPVDVSLALLEAIHGRWVLLLKAMAAPDFARTFRRPDGQVITLNRALQTYAWHGRHHAAQITTLRQRMGW
ncbi:MAG TPA: putative metal-dependent hydrolase [Candidatus Sulfotelmatobacter sp.]|nr:putative metal-dependent hydrolase [Candidatus Sulfotelmatobacter sp.]